MRLALLIPLAAFGLFAQPEQPFSFSAGVKVGAPINDMSSRSSLYGPATQSRWTGGPTVEFHLPAHFSIEFDALYRNYRVNTNIPFQFGASVNSYITSVSRKPMYGTCRCS